jgi:hypothetical protein
MTGTIIAWALLLLLAAGAAGALIMAIAGGIRAVTGHGRHR